MIPKQLEKQIIEWHHNAICYPGETSTEPTISQNLCKVLHQVCTKFKACHFLKRNKKQYSKVPLKEVEINL